MTTEAAIVDAIYGTDYPWDPIVRTRLRTIAGRMLTDGLDPLVVAVYMSDIIEAVWEA